MRRTVFLALLPLIAAAPLAAQSHAGHSETTTATATAFASDRISVTTTGSGPDVILIPGLASSPEVWQTTVAAVPGYRYHLVQVKGFSGTAPEANGSGPVVVPLAEEIARYIADTGLDKPAIVGHSMGGTLGMLIATRHPDRVGKLMVVDMFPFIGAMFGGPGATPDSVRPMAEMVRAGISSATGEARRAQQEQTIAGMVRTESMRPMAVAHGLASDAATSGQAMHDLIVTDLSADLARYTGPMTVLWAHGPGAPISQEMMGGFYTAAYSRAPQATVTFVPDSAHFIMWDAAGRFQTELRTFLGR